MSLDFLKRLAGMTRETKLGLVVACSFLSLLGVVLGLKMNEGAEATPTPQNSPVAENAPPPASSGREEAPEAPHGGPPTVAAQADGGHTPTPAQFQEPPDAKILPPAGGLVPVEARTTSIPKNDGGFGGGIPIPSLPAAEPVAGVPLLPPATKTVWGKMWSGAVVRDNRLESVSVEPTVPAPPVLSPAPPPVPPLTPSPKATNVWARVWAGEKRDPVKVTFAPPPPGGDAFLPPEIPQTPAVTIPTLPVKPPTLTVERGSEDSGTPGIPGLPPPNKGTTNSNPKPPPVEPTAALPTVGEVSITMPGPGEKAPPAPPPLPPAGGTKGDLPEIGALPVNPPKPTPTVTEDKAEPRGVTDLTIPPLRTEKKPKETVPAVGSLPPTPVPSEPTGTSPPPRIEVSEAPAPRTPPVSIGTVAGRTVPPPTVTPELQRTPRGPQPKVIEYLESMRKIQPGETFETISREQYGSKDYATALLLYNRGHPIVGESFASDNPTLTPGQRIFLPSNKELLESRYPSAIRSVATQTQSNAPPPADPVPPKVYTVAVGGETFARVALKLFDNVDRWTEIRNLNRELDPEKPIPPGTILKVPGDARMP